MRAFLDANILFSAAYRDQSDLLIIVGANSGMSKYADVGIDPATLSYVVKEASVFPSALEH